MDADLLTSMLAPLTALMQVLLIDLALAGDNAVVVGLAVSGLPAHQKRPAILFGIGAATLLHIILADFSMSLDNVLAVAGAATGHPWVLVAGLAISVILMGLAAQFVATLLEKHRWIAWAGLVIVLYVALKMIWDGGREIWHHLA